MEIVVKKVADDKYEISLTLAGKDKTYTEWALETLEGKQVATYIEGWLPQALGKEIQDVIARHSRGPCGA